MKKIKLTFVFLFVATLMFAQKSPRNQVTGKVGETTIEIDYSAPSVKGRTIWGGLEKYGEVWRAGADANTTFSFDNDVVIGGTTIPAGKYGFFIIPNKKGDWVAIFSKTNNQWGAYSYKPSEDALRVNIPPSITKNIQEQLKYSVGKKSINFAWEYINLSIPITVK